MKASVLGILNDAFDKQQKPKRKEVLKVSDLEVRTRYRSASVAGHVPRRRLNRMLCRYTDDGPNDEEIRNGIR